MALMYFHKLGRRPNDVNEYARAAQRADWKPLDTLDTRTVFHLFANKLEMSIQK